MWGFDSCAQYHQFICTWNNVCGSLASLFSAKHYSKVDIQPVKSNMHGGVYFMDFPSIPATSMKGTFTFHFLFPDIIRIMSLLEVSKGEVEIRDPLSSSSMEGWAPALLPVSDASIDKARGKMATVHPGACILKLLPPAALRWALTAQKNTVWASPEVSFSLLEVQFHLIF